MIGCSQSDTNVNLIKSKSMGSDQNHMDKSAIM